MSGWRERDGDRSDGTEAQVRVEELGGRTHDRRSGELDLPGWWEASDRAEPEVAEAAGRLAALTERVDQADLSEPIESIVRDHDSDDLARAVGELYGSLARAAGRTVSDEEAAGIRRRIDRVTEALWSADVRSERELCRDVLREVSHDIRSPLNSILFLAEGLYSGRSGSLSDAQRRQLGVVYSASATLLNMVNDLLDFARTSEGETEEMARVAFSVASVLGDVRRLVGPVAEHRGCRLRTEMEVQDPRQGDPQIVSRVLVNLVSNAIDAAGEGGEVVVRVTGDDETLRLQVLDDGDGAEPERLERLAAPESDAGLTRTLTGETHGLGLVICGRLVRGAGGSLEVSGTPEGWTDFRVLLPFGRN